MIHNYSDFTKSVHSADSVSKQKAHINTLRKTLPGNPELFRKVYKHTFLLARQQGQKALPLDMAFEYWSLLFTSPGIQWSTSSTPWFEWYKEYLEAKWKKSVNKDMWDQTLVFALKSLEDESMSWWSEDGAWPGVIDDFVGFVREKRAADGGMEVE